MTAVPGFLVDHQTRILDELNRMVPEDTVPPEAVHRSMRYTLLAPSKRVRAALALLAAELFGGTERAMPVAGAIELIHASSLILDDLPSMDHATLRRGRPANHLAFGEATAILAAFGLLNAAFSAIARAYEAALARRVLSILTDAVGTEGLIGGQADDLEVERHVTFERLERIHRLKTGALFGAAATGGAVAAGADPDQVRALAAYAKNLGLAFQIVDDLLDVEGVPAETGKAHAVPPRQTTFVSFSGVAGARQLAGELCETANRALQPFGDRADRLRALSDFVAARTT